VSAKRSFVWSCVSAPVELLTHYITVDSVVDIGSTSASMECVMCRIQSKVIIGCGQKT